MAAIDSIVGIDLVSGTDREYEISADVAIGSNIDDPPPFSVFTVISGGRYRFVAGCNTTFDRSQWIERDASTVYGEDNYAGTNCRFSGGATCAPVFQGCRFVQEDGLARSDWDIASDGAAPTFETASDGSKCVITIYDSASATQFNHFANENPTVNGLIMDHQRSGGAMEFRIPPDIQDLEVVDNNPGSSARHVVVLMFEFATGATHYINKLSCRNVATFSGFNTGETLVLRNPVTDLERSTDDGSQGGIMQVERSYLVAAQDAVTQTDINPTIVITATSDNDVRYDEALVSGEFNNYLFQYEFRYNNPIVNPETKYSDDEYRRALVLWGYDPKVKTFTLGWDANSPDGTNDGTLFFFAKAGVTEALQSTVDAYTALENTTKLFDALHRYEIVRTDRHNVGDVLVLASGTAMDMGTNNLTITNAVVAGYPLTLSGTTFTCYTEASAFTLGAFNTITTTGTVTFSQANTFPDSITIDGDAVLSEVTDADGFSVTGTLDLETAGTYNWGDMETGAVGELTNSSGGNITIVTDNAASITLNTGPNITISAPVINTGLAFTGLVSGSQIVVCDTGTQTERYRVNSSGASETWSELYSADDVVDYTVMLAGYDPIRVTGVAIGNTVLDVPIQQTQARAYEASSGLTYAVNATVNTGTKRFGLTAASTVQNLYSFWIEAWIAESALVNTKFPIVPFGPDSFTFADGYEFDASASIDNLSRDGFRYTDVSGVLTAGWGGFLSVNSGSVAAFQAEYQQVSGAAPTDTISTGAVDQCIQLYGDATHGNFDYRSYLVFKMQPNGYFESRADIPALYGVASLSFGFYVFGLEPQVISGFTTGDPAISVTLVDHTAAPITVGGVNFSWELQDNGTESAEDIQRDLNFYKSGDATSTDYLSLDPFNLPDWIRGNPDLGLFSTLRNYVEGESGQLGLYVSRSAADHPGFTSFQGDDGSTYTPAVQVSVINSNLISGTRVQVYNVTQGAPLYNDTLPGVGLSEGFLFGAGQDIESGDTIRYRAAYHSGTSYKEPIEGFAVATGSDIEFLDVQVDWLSVEAWAIDGSGVTEFSADLGNIDIDLDDGDGTTQKTRLGAWWAYLISTSSGIANFWGAYSIPAANVIRQEVDALDVVIHNVGTLNVRFTDNDVRYYRSDNSLPYDPTGNSIFMDYTGVPDVVETGVSGLTTPESNQLFGTALQTTLVSIGDNVDSILADTGTTIPAQISALNDPSAVEIRAEMDLNSTQLAAIADDVATTIPLQIAGQDADVKIVEGAITQTQAFRAMLADASGDITDDGANGVIKSTDGLKDRATFTYDESGNRVVSSRDLT